MPQSNHPYGIIDSARGSASLTLLPKDSGGVQETAVRVFWNEAAFWRE